MAGLHHVTTIAGNALRNLDFYTRILGLRLVKRTVNFDDPGTYHLYYGDDTGHPGTVLTFFPWEHAVKGRLGVGETEQTAFRVPARALGYWTQRLIEKSVAHEMPEKRFGETVLPFSDADGTSLALVAVPEAENEPAWSNGEIPAEHAIRGFYGVTLLLTDAARTGAILTGVLGFAEAGRDPPLPCGSRGTGRRRRHPPSRGPTRPARTRLGASHRVPRRRRCRAGGDGKVARDAARGASDRSARPPLFPLDLFPRAGRRAVRNRDRHSRLRGGRAGRLARRRAQAAAVPRAAPARDRAGAAGA
jgi:catechol 2,3-dioxygenase-like lactoylglutathione lyase family enzyme